MTLTTRRILFTSFVLSFAILAPILVLFTAGYRFNPRTGNLVRTGAISTTSTPKGAGIWLNGEYTGKNTAHILKRVIPSTYLIELSRTGFMTWKGRTKVDPGATSFINSPLLIRDDSPFLEEEVSLDLAEVSPSGAKVAAADGRSLLIWNIEDTTPNLSVGGLLKFKPTSLKWSESEQYILASTENRFTVMTAGHEMILHGEFSGENESAIFEGDELVVRTPSFETRTNLETLAKTRGKEDQRTLKADGFTIKLEHTESDTVIRIEKDGRSQTLGLLEKDDYELLDQSGGIVLLKKGVDEIALIDTTSNEPLLLERSATLYDWDKTSERLVYSDGFELSYYSFELDRVRLLTRTSVELQDIELYGDGHYVLYASNKEVAAIETEAIGLERYSVILADQFSLIHDLELSTDERSLWITGETDTQGIFKKRLR